MTANYLKKNILRIGRCTRRTIQNQHRRLIACILVFTFTLTMTGMNTVVAHAWNWQASVNKVKTAAVKAVTATSTYKTVKSSYNSIKIAYSSAKNYKTDALKTASQKVKNNVPAASNRTEAVGKTAPASLAIKPLVAAIPASPISQATDFLSQIIPSPYNPMTDFGKVTSVNVASLSPAISIYPDMQSPSMFGGGTVAKPAETLRPPQIDLNTAATLSGQELPDTQNQLRPTVADQPKAGQTLTTSSASSSQQRANLGAFTNIATKAVSFFSAPIITRAEQVYNLAQNSNNPTIQNLVQGSDHIKQTITQVTGQMLALLQGEKLRPSDGSGVPGVTMALTMLLPTKTSQEDQNQPIVPDKVQEAIDTLPADQIQQQGELAGILGQGALTDQRIQDAQSWINNIPAEQVSMQDVGAALRINQIMGEQVVDPTRLVNSVAEQLNQHARGADWKMNMDTAKPGQINSPLGQIGTVTKNNNGYTLTNSVDTGKGIIEVKINFIPNEKSEQTGFLDNWTYNSKEEPLQVSSVTTTTNYGQQTEQMFNMNKGQLELTATRMTVTVNDPTTAMSFEQNVLVDLNTQKAFYQEQDQIYTIDVNLETGQGMIVSVEGPETRQEALLAIATAESSFRFYGNQAVDFNGKQLAHVEITPEMLQDRGLNQDQRNHLVVGESAILTQDGTIYVGNQDDFRSGNYNVIGRNMFENAGDLGYVATYKNGELDTAKLSNGKEIADISGSRDGRLTGFNVYAEREDGSGEAVSNYQGGNLQGTSLTLNNFIDHQDQNIVLRYDRSGNITPGSLDDLRGGGQDFTFENMDNGGFKLVSTTEGVLTEIYTATGGRVLPGGEGGGGVQPGLIEFNIEKSITMNIAKYNDEKGVDVKLEEVSKHQVMVNLTPGSGLTKTVTQSSVAGEVEIHSTDAWGAGGSDWTRIETQGTQQGLVNGQYVDAKVFTQLKNQDGNIQGVTGIVEQHLTNDNGLHTTDSNGGLKFTGVVDKTEIDMTAGMTPLNTVEMTSCVVPEDMKIAEQIGISHEAAVAVKKQASYFAGQKITGEAYGDKGMVTIHRGVGETGEVNYGTDGTYIGKEGGIARLYAAVDEDKGVLNIARVSGDTEAAIELGAPAEMVAAATSPGKQTHFGSAKIEDTVYINDNIISFSVSAAPDQTGEYAFLVSGGGCDEQMEFTAAWTNSRFEIIEADVSLNLINNPDSGLNLPDTVIDSANTGKTYIGGMGETETNMGLLEMSLETFGQEAVTRINNADYVNADSKVKIFLGQDDGATTYGLAGVGRTSEGDLNIISMLNTDTNKMELAHVHGDTDAMRSFGVPSVLVDKIELGNVWVGSEKYENVQFVRGNGVATIDIARETATGNTRFMIQGSKDGGLVFAEIKAEFISFSAGNQVMIDSKPVILTEAMGNPQAIMLKGDKGFMLDMGVSEAEIKGLDGSAKILAGNRVDYIAGGEYEIRVSENSVDGKAVFSPIGVIETDEGNIMVMAGMTGDEMKVQTASGSKVAFGAAGIGEELLGYLAAGEGQTYKGLEIIYEQDGMVNLQFTEDGDKLSGIIKLESGETLQVTTGIKTKNVANKPDHWVHGITVVPYVVDVVTNGLTVPEAIGLQVESLSGTDAALKDAGITVQNEHKFHYTQHGERIKYSNNGIYTIVLGDGQELVAGTVLMNLEDGQAEVSVLTGVTGIKTAFINGKSIGATDEGTLMLGVVGDKISIRNTQTNTYRLYNSAGVKKTGWLTRVHNTQYEAFIGLSNAWESGHKHGAEFRTNFLAGKGWAALDSGYRIVSCAFAVIGNAAMGGIMWTLAPVTSGLDYMADNWFRDQGATWYTKSLCATAYFGAKFVSQNLMLIAIIGASLVCPAVGMAFLGVMAMAEMTKGFVGGFVATISNFFIHPFTEFVHGISLLWHNSYSVTNAFNVADNMLVLSAGALGIFFAFMMGAHAYRIVKPTAQIIAVGFLGRVLDITYRSKSEFKPESGRVREILLSEKSYYQKGIELRNLYKEAKVKGKENEAVEGKGVGEVGPQRTGEPKGTGGIRREVVLEGSTLRTAKDIMLELNKPVEIGTGKGGLLTLELTGKTGTTGKTTINVKVDPKTGDVTLRVEGGKPVIIESGGKLPEIRISDGQLVSIRQVPSEVVFLEGRVTGASNAIRNAKTPGEALMAGLKHTRAMENLAQGLRTKGADIQAESVMRAAKSGDALGAKLLTKLMENPAAETMKLVESLEKTAEAKKDGKKSRDKATEAQEILAETGRSIGRNPAMARTMFKNNLVSKTMAESMFESGKGKSSERLVMEIGKSSEAAGNLFKALEGTKSESAVEMIIKRAAEMDNRNSVQRQTLNLDQGSRLMRNILEAARQDSNLANKIYDLAAKDSKVLDSAARHLASVAEGKNGLITKVRNLRRRPKDLSEAISREAMSKLERYVDAAEKATLKADAAKGEAGKGEGAKAEPAKPEPKSFGDKVTDYASYVAKNPVAFTQNVFAYLSGMKFMQMGMARLKKYAQTRNDKAFEKLAGEQLLRKTAKNQAEIAASEAKTTRMVNSEPMSTGRYNPLRAANRGLDRVFKNRPVNRLIKEMGKRAEMEAQQAKLAQRMSDMRATADKIIQSTPPLDVVRQVAESMGKYGKDVLKAESTGRDLIEAKARFNDATRSRKTTARDIQVLENQGNKAAIEVIRANEARGRAVAELQNGRGGIHAETVLRKFETQSAEKITKNELEVQTAGTKVEALTKTKNNQEAMQKLAETRAARDQLMEKRAATSNQRQKNRLSRRIKACESKISELEKRLEPLEKASSELQQLETARENILKEITYLGRQAGVAERLVSSRGSVEPIVTLMESMAFKSQVEIFKSVESQKATEIMRAMSFEGLSEYGRQLSWKEVTQQADALIKGKNYQVAGDLLAWRAEIFKGKPGERMIDKPDYAKALEQSSSSVMQDYARLNSKKVVPGSVIETLKDFKKFLEAREQLSLETALKQFNMKNSESGRSYLDARQLKLTDRNSVDACLDTLITPQSKAARTKILEATHQLAHMDARIDRARSLGREAEAMELEKQYAKVEKEINRLETKVGEEYTALPNTKTVIKNTKILRTESAKDLALEMSEFMQKKPGESEATYTKRLQKEGHLKDADMTEAFITTWRKTYKSIFKAEFQGKPQKIAQYRATIEAYRKGINKVLGAKKGEPGYQLLDGKSMHARFIQLRDQMIKDGKLKAGSIAEARFNRVYGEIVFTRVTGYKGMRLAQKVMLSEFFGGNNVGLKAGGGKTNVFIMFPGLARMMTGKALRSEILVDDAAAINKYITERQKATGLVQGELAKAFGVELKNGMKLYEAGKQNGYVELIEALRNPNQVVILDHTSRAHLRNAEVSNPALRSALREANLVGIDEVHMAATSQTSAIIGGKVSAPDVKLVRQVDNMLTKLGFDYAYYKNYNTKGEVKLGNGFKVETGLRMQSMYDPRVAKQVETAANSPDRIITLTKDGPKLNGEAGKALRQFTDVEIEATLKTLYSRQGKAGEYNSYIIEGKKIYPVDQLGGIQRQQISNDIVGQITAARINGLDPHTAVRVSETSMQTPLSAMYAGNHNARIVGASGTVTGIENLMKNKIGSDTTHISTSKLDAQTMIYETGVGKRKGEILTSLSSGDSVVYHTIEHKQAGHKKALVFEADPVTQIELVQQYTGRLKANKPVIGIMNVESTGYYVPKGTGRSFIETYKLNAKIDAPPRGGEVIGYEYIRITKEGIQTIVENANKIDNQIMIINEQGATGKNYQAHMTLVVRNGHALTSDVLTQLLLRTGRSGKSSTESWDTTRYVCVEAREMFNTVETAKGRLSEIRELAKVDTTADHALIKLLESYQKIKAENITPRDLLEINAKYRQMELIGDSTRFSVQDTFRDQIVIDPFKQILRQMKNPSAKAGEILNAELTRVLNPKAAETADIMLRSRSEQLPTDINRYYAQQTFRGSIREAKTAWKNVVYSSIRSPKAWFSQNILYSGRQLISLYRADLYVSRGKTAEVQKGAILAETRNLLELYQLGENMMKRVLSREAGGAEINAMRNQVSKIAEAVKDSELAITKTEQKTLGDTWKASHKQFKNLPKLNNGMSWTVAMVAQRLNLQKTDGTPDLDTARLIMAPNYGQAVRMIQGDLLLFNKYIDQEMSPGLSEAQKIEVQEIGVRRIGTFLRTLPLVHGFLQSWDTRAMNKAQYRQLPQAIAGLEALIHQKQAATEPVTAAAAAAGVAAAAAVAAQAAEQEVITYQGRSMTLEQAQKYLAHMQAGQEDLQGRYGIIDGQNKYVGMFSKLWQGYSLRSITSWNPSALRSRVGSEMRAHWIPLTGLIAATAILLVSGVGTASGAVALSFVMGGVIPAQQVERLLPRTKTTAATVEPVGIRFEESEQPLSSGQQSVMQAWKAEVGQSRDGIMAYEALAHILSSLGVEINVAEKAKTYGYMHMLAALFDLVPAFEVSPDSRVVPDIWQEMKAQGIKAQQEGLATLYIATQAEGADQEAGVLNVDQSTLAFFEQRFAEVLLNGAVQAAERVMFTGKERELLDLWLMENSAFKNDAHRVTEFIKQYIMSGEDLRNLVQVNTGLQPVHALVAKKFGGYEFKEGDLIELNQAILEIESGAYLLMAVKAEGIESASSRIRQVRAAEFEQTFGISYTAYKEMITPPMVQRIMQYVFSAKDFGRNNQPTVNVKTAGRQMLGIGTVAVIIGGVVLGTVSGALPVALGLAALGAGAVLVMEGALVWIRSGKIAFDLNPSDAVAEQLWAADFASADPEMAQAAGVIQDLMQAGKKAEAGQKRESFTKQFGMSYQTYQKITLPALLRNPGFVKAVANLGIKGTRQVVSETMQNRAIRFALEHLVAVVDSDISKEAKIQLTEDVVQVLGILQFQVNMKYDKHADALKVQLTPETIPRTLTKDNKIGRLFKNLEGMGISIKLQFAPIKKPIKLKSTGSAA